MSICWPPDRSIASVILNLACLRVAWIRLYLLIQFTAWAWALLPERCLSAPFQKLLKFELNWAQPIKPHPSLPCSWSNVFIGRNCLGLGLSHCVCFPFKEPELCMSTSLFWVHTLNGQLEARPLGAICWNWQNVYWIRIVDYSFNKFIILPLLSALLGS